MLEYSLIRHVHAVKKSDEIRLIWAFGKNRITGKNYPLGILVSCFGLKYKLIDVDSLIVISPEFERDYQKFIMPREGDTFIDIGANVGKYTIQVAKKVGENGRVIAFEADPITFRALSDGIMANDHKNVVAYNIAVYDKECDIVLHSPVIDGKSNLGKAHSSIKIDVGPGVLVKASPLDLILKNLNLTKVDFIKIDVEGAELEVIKGAYKTIEKFKPKLVMEITTSNSEIFDLMNELGYICRSIGPSYYYFVPIGRS